MDIDEIHTLLHTHSRNKKVNNLLWKQSFAQLTWFDTEETDLGPLRSEGVAAGVTFSWDSEGVAGWGWPAPLLDVGGWGLRVGIVWSAGGTDAGWEWGFGSGDGAAEAGEPTDGTGTVSPRPLPPCKFGSGLGVKDWPWGYEGGPPDGVPEPPTNLQKEHIQN